MSSTTKRFPIRALERTNQFYRLRVTDRRIQRWPLQAVRRRHPADYRTLQIRLGIVHMHSQQRYRRPDQEGSLLDGQRYDFSIYRHLLRDPCNHKTDHGHGGYSLLFFCFTLSQITRVTEETAYRTWVFFNIFDLGDVGSRQVSYRDGTENRKPKNTKLHTYYVCIKRKFYLEV